MVLALSSHCQRLSPGTSDLYSLRSCYSDVVVQPRSVHGIRGASKLFLDPWR